MKAAKKSINFEIDLINQKIADNEARIKALAEHMNIDPEEGKKLLAEAKAEAE